MHTDQLGSPIAATNDSGAWLWYEEYQPYGLKLNGVNEEIGFTGHVYDSDTGLTDMQARLYDPLIGRFLSTDPIGFNSSSPFTFNRYTYANNNPIGNVDPDGRACSALNTSSLYCLRRDTYNAFDRAAGSQTRFFGAAARTVEYLADNDIPGSSLIGPSAQAQGFLQQVSENLYSLNAATFSDIMAGRLSGPNLDDRMISTEQTRVQSMLDALQVTSDRQSLIQSILCSPLDLRVQQVVFRTAPMRRTIEL